VHQVTFELTLRVSAEEVGAPNTPEQAQFKRDVRTAIARHLYISESRIVVMFVRAGGDVGIRIIDIEGATYGSSVTPGLMTNEPSASAVVALLQSQLSAGTMPIGSYTALRTAMLLPPPSKPPSMPPVAPPSPLPPFSPPGPTWVELYVTVTNMGLAAMLLLCCCCCCLGCFAWARRKRRKEIRELADKHRKEHEDLELKKTMAATAAAEHSLHELEHQEKLAELTRQHEQERLELEERKATMMVLAEMQKKLVAARTSVAGGNESRISTAVAGFGSRLRSGVNSRLSRAPPRAGSKGSKTRQPFTGLGFIPDDDEATFEVDAVQERIEALEQTVRDLESQERRLAEKGEYAAAANVSKKAIDARMKLDKERDRIKREAAPPPAAKKAPMPSKPGPDELKVMAQIEELQEDLARYKQEEDDCVHSRDYQRAGKAAEKAKYAQEDIETARAKLAKLEEDRKKRAEQGAAFADAPYLNQLKGTVTELEAKEEQLATNRDYMGAAAAHSELLATRARLEAEEQRIQEEAEENRSTGTNKRDSMADVMEERERNGDVYTRGKHGEMKLHEEGAVTRRGIKERPERVRRGTVTSNTLKPGGQVSFRHNEGEDGALTLREKIARRKMSTLAKPTDSHVLDHQNKLAQKAAEKQAAALAATMSAKTREELSEAKQLQEEAVAYATIAKRKSNFEFARAMCTSELHASSEPSYEQEEQAAAAAKSKSLLKRMSNWGSKAPKVDPNPVSGTRYSKVGDSSPRDDDSPRTAALEAEKNAMLVMQSGAGVGAFSEGLGPETTRMVAEANAVAVSISAGLGPETTRMVAEAKAANLTEASKAAAMDEALLAMLEEQSYRASSVDRRSGRERGLSA